MRARVLSPTELLARLDSALPLLRGGTRDLPDRQRTMERAIDWSHDLLTAAEARLFRRLANFVGGWDLVAAEAAGAATGEDASDALLALTALVEQALVVVASGTETAARYRMLEPPPVCGATPRDERDGAC